MQLSEVCPVCRSGRAPCERDAVALPSGRSEDEPGRRNVRVPPVDRSQEASRRSWPKAGLRQLA
eukprot:1044260-Pyramimonas_sp.AAC.2